jgi:hypothetical protein
LVETHKIDLRITRNHRGHVQIDLPLPLDFEQGKDRGGRRFRGRGAGDWLASGLN